jgi:hypothetical protein
LATVLNSDLKALLKVYRLGIGTGQNKAGLTGRLLLEGVDVIFTLENGAR